MELNEDILYKFATEQYPDADIKFIGKGWGSFAFQADNKVLRFARREIKVYINDKNICDFVRDKISFPVPRIEIFEDVKYPYATHEIIPGRLWNDKYARGLAESAQDALAKDIAKFLAELHAIDASEILKISTGGHLAWEAAGPFIEEYFSAEQIDTLRNKYEKAIAVPVTDTVLCHNDFHGGNSVLDENNRLAGVFDWANHGICERADEFRHLCNPKNPEFCDKIFDEYEKLTGVKIDRGRLMELDMMECVGAVYWLHNMENMEDLKSKEMKLLVDKLKNHL